MLNGFKFGFLIGYTTPITCRGSKILKSAKETPQVVEQKLVKEVTLIWMACHFKNIPFPKLSISPVDLVPKKDGDVRLPSILPRP